VRIDGAERRRVGVWVWQRTKEAKGPMFGFSITIHWVQRRIGRREWDG